LAQVFLWLLSAGYGPLTNLTQLSPLHNGG